MRDILQESIEHAKTLLEEKKSCCAKTAERVTDLNIFLDQLLERSLNIIAAASKALAQRLT